VPNFNTPPSRRRNIENFRASCVQSIIYKCVWSGISRHCAAVMLSKFSTGSNLYYLYYILLRVTFYLTEDVLKMRTTHLSLLYWHQSEGVNRSEIHSPTFYHRLIHERNKRQLCKGDWHSPLKETTLCTRWGGGALSISWYTKMYRWNGYLFDQSNISMGCNFHLSVISMDR
jgi:hypothetical protein